MVNLELVNGVLTVFLILDLNLLKEAEKSATLGFDSGSQFYKKYEDIKQFVSDNRVSAADKLTHKKGVVLRDIILADQKTNCDRVGLYRVMETVGGGLEVSKYLATGYESTLVLWVLYVHLIGLDSKILLAVEDGWEERMKILSVVVKSCFPVDWDYAVMTELVYLKGFTPSTIDLIAETKDFANSGKNLSKIAEKRWCNVIESMNLKSETKPFKEFVLSGKWRTAGASGRKIEILNDGKEENKRVNKNALIYIESYPQILDLCRTVDKAENAVAIKNEVSKTRIVVSAPLNMFFVPKWVDDTTKSRVAGMSKSIVADRSGEEMDKLTEQWKLKMVGKFVISFDYRKFDHQMTNSMLMCVLDKLVSAMTVDLEEAELLRQMKKGFADAELVLNSSQTNGQGTMRFKISGGVPSGSPLTTTFGNLMSYGFARIAGIDDDNFLVKGDDCLIVVDSYDAATRFLDLMREFGVDFDVKKSYIRYESGEFLRQMISVTGSKRIAARALVSVVQKKPWSESVLSDFRDQPAAVALKTFLDRAGLKLDLNKVRFFKTPRNSVPEVYGGAGVWPEFLGIKRYTPSQAFKRSRVKVLSRNVSYDWASNIIASDLSSKADHVTDEMSKQDLDVLLSDKEKIEQKAMVGKLNYAAWLYYTKPYHVKIPELWVRYYSIFYDMSRAKVIRIFYPAIHYSFGLFKKWGYAAAEKFVTTGFERPKLLVGSDDGGRSDDSLSVDLGEDGFRRGYYEYMVKYHDTGSQ